MSLEELEKRIKVLEDIDQIQKLQVRYVNCLTTASWPEVLDCFAENAVVDFPQGVWRGREGTQAVFRDLVSLMHVGLEGNFVVHPIVTVDGDTAKGSWLLYTYSFAVLASCRPILPISSGASHPTGCRGFMRWSMSASGEHGRSACCDGAVVS